MEFNTYKYITDKYSAEALEQFQDDQGINGWDLLLSSETAEEADSLLEDYQG